MIQDNYIYKEEDICVLIATMDKTYEECIELIKRMKIKSSYILVNQCGKDEVYDLEDNSKIIFSINRGLSNSRNLAIKYCKSKICIISDDDIVLSENYTFDILNAYNRFKSDIIVFDFETDHNVRVCKRLAKTEGKIGFLKSLKVCSVRITFKRKAIVDNQIYFDTLFGAGSTFNSGEENILLRKCLDKNLNLFYVPIIICNVDFSESSWFNGYNQQFFETKGAFGYAVFGKYYFIYMFQFILRKYRLFNKNIGIWNVISSFNRGKKEYIKLNNERTSFNNNTHI